jgi:hypothetical protein
MRIKSPFACDFCGIKKGDNNHWFLVRSSERRGIGYDVQPWDEDHADDAGIQHACSEQCVTKSLNQWFTTLHV